MLKSEGVRSRSAPKRNDSRADAAKAVSEGFGSDLERTSQANSNLLRTSRASSGWFWRKDCDEVLRCALNTALFNLETSTSETRIPFPSVTSSAIFAMSRHDAAFETKGPTAAYDHREYPSALRDAASASTASNSIERDVAERISANAESVRKRKRAASFFERAGFASARLAETSVSIWLETSQRLAKERFFDRSVSNSPTEVLSGRRCTSSENDLKSLDTAAS